MAEKNSKISAVNEGPKENGELNGLTFEEAMDRIEKITEMIESGELKLDESIAAFEEGSRLVKYCRAKLEEYGKKIDAVSGSDEDESVF